MSSGLTIGGPHFTLPLAGRVAPLAPKARSKARVGGSSAERVARLLALSILAVSCTIPAFAQTVGCTPIATIRWETGAPVEHRYEGEEFGPTVFGLDMAKGEYWEHLVGGRAGVSGDGRLDIVPTVNSGSRDEFVGIDREDGALFRIRRAANPIALIRTHASGEIDIGTCVPGTLIDAIEALP